MTLAGGSLIFLAFVVFYTLVVTYSLYTRTGSGINQRPWGRRATAPSPTTRPRRHSGASLGARNGGVDAVGRRARPSRAAGLRG